ncbi:MAG: FAD-dependent oxidoreductase [Deltaproteobacteria bacterium]|nr:FAD-dependent oxidoreductase [Deltaproteobacteria bacterium]
MTLRLSQVALDLDEDESRLRHKVAEHLGIAAKEISDLRIVRRGIDARRKPRLFRIFSVDFEVADQVALLHRHRDNKNLREAPGFSAPEIVPITGGHRVLVVGMGPAGLFAALRLAQSGADVALVERGRELERRCADVQNLWQEGVLDAESNPQFGEGGAGTFSDGKLTTRINDPWIPEVLRILVECGAPEDILVEAKPHVGTDRLRRVLRNFRKRLISLGVDIRFETRLTGLLTRSGRVCGAILNDRNESPCASLVLAPGHSARDTYRMLHKQGVEMETKPFAMGLRVEHPAAVINAIQWGHARHPRLPAADYRLSHNNAVSGRGAYSFCMCPGGEVIVASSEPGALVVNGMSCFEREGEFSNSALVVSVRRDDFDGDDPLAGVRFQRRWEEKAFRSGGGNYFAPAQNLLRFLGMGSGPFKSTARPGVREVELGDVLPSFVADELREALPWFGRKMPGFVSAEATLTGIESRTSAPLRILRGADGQSVSHAGLYPIGEGAGYAGGIVSSAVDGLKAADLIAKQHCQNRNRK